MTATATQISAELRDFTDLLPWERGPILDFVTEVAAATPPGAAVLDLGAGDAPYRELFAHTSYQTTDWEHSIHPGAQDADIIAPADRLPLPDGGLDVVFCTQVLEHVPDPSTVLDEVHRILAPGGWLHLSVPLVWELHELPYDFYRYTEPGLRHLLAAAGFEAIDVRGRNDCFATLAQLLRSMGHIMGRADDGLDARRDAVAGEMWQLADSIAALGPLDARGVFPLGYRASGVKPG